MLQSVMDHIRAFLGYNHEVSEVNAIQMALRTILIYAATLALVRLRSTRFLSQANAFDVVVGIMLGSVMGRAINSSAPLVPTLVAGAVFVGLHWLLSVLAEHTAWFGAILKGNPILLIKDGQVQRRGVREVGLSERDLREALRLQAHETDPSKVRLAYLERNGRVSVIPRERDPQILEVAVADGVQTVRIELQ
jgi:uncharacterized membrane protein YcaP (DUF421 family)